MGHLYTKIDMVCVLGISAIPNVTITISKHLQTHRIV